MAKIRRGDAKAVLGQQRSQIKRGARGKSYVGDDTGSERARAAEREKVHKMQELQHTRQLEEERRHLEGLRRERERDERRRREELEHEEHLHEPVLELLGELVSDTYRLARTFFFLPFRMAQALRGRAPRGAES